MSRFIVFEGLDGTGKSSLISCLTQHLLKQGASVHLAAYPRKTGDGAIGRQLCAEDAEAPKIFHYMMLDMLKGNAWLSTSSADFILLDRYYYSALGYQYGYYKGLKLEDIYQKRSTFQLLRQPDLCLYAHCSYQTARWRIINRDGLDSDDLKFYASEGTWQRMRNAYNLGFSMKMLQPKNFLSINTEAQTDDMMSLLPDNILDLLYGETQTT